MVALTPAHAELIGLIVQSALYGIYIINASEKKNVAKTVLYILQTFVGDFTMIYRLFIVWGRDWRIILLPSLSSLGLLVAGSGASYSFAHLKSGESVFVSSAGHWIVAVFVTTLTSNVIVTGKIWSIDKKTNKLARSGNAMFVVQIILESAGLYTISLIVTHIGYLTNQTYEFVALDATSPIIGISFSLIIVRVGLGASTEGHDTTLPSSMVNGAWSSHAVRQRSTYTPRDPIPLTEITVNIDQEVVTDDAESLKHGGDVYSDASKRAPRREEWHP
ncbi:hypothetical protein BDQ12DRAFT_727017 [Crucibulum laeve]|uniref:Uncharacterized protein n=1 Tax=Crucibulum laeve TaxID=68775 RepID=A0A5C3LNC8_9AGAR|nr:hypothetical protein BDQ12DRAFT_727017 [Crucibulum laeve]